MYMFEVVAGASTPSQLSIGRVSGLVVDEDESPLSGAAIQLFMVGADMARYSAISGADGSFEIKGVPEGRYDAMVSYIGFGTRRYPIHVEASKTSHILVTLLSEAVVYDEVVVSAGRAREQLSPVTFSNISAEELSQQPDMKDLPVHLARQPSITFHSENGNAIGYSTLRMRGFDQRRLAVSINGIPQNDPEEFNVFWINFFDIQGAVQDIQIQRGSGSSVYGTTAIGGAINVRALPYKSDFYASVQVGGGAFGTQRYSSEVNSGLLGNRYVVYGRLSRLLSDGYRDWSWTEFWRYFVGITRYGDRSTLTIQSFGGPQRDGLAYSGIPKSANKRSIDDGFGGTIDRKYNFSSLDGDVENFHQPHVEIHHTYDLSSEWQLSQSAFWIKGEGYFDFGGTFRSANYLRLPTGTVDEAARSLPLYLSRPDVGLLFRAYLDQWQIGWIPKATHSTSSSTTTYGLEARLHRSLRWGRIQEATGLPAALSGSTNDVRVYSFRGEKSILSAYASHLQRISDLWAIQIDARLTSLQYRIWDESFFGTSFSTSYAFVNPRIGVTYRPEQAISAYTSVAVSSREPRMKSLYDGEEAGAGFEPRFLRNLDGSLNTNKPLIKPERLIDLELGATWKGERFRTSANIFLMQFKDELVPSGGLDQYGVPRTGNADKTRHLGLEIDASIKIARGLDFAGNFTWSRNRFIQFDEYATRADFSTTILDRSDKTIAGFPSQSGNATIIYSKSGFTASLMTSLVGEQFVDNGSGTDVEGLFDNERVLESYVLIDASFGYLFSTTSALDGLKIGVDLNNVLDSKVLSYGQVSFGTPEFFPAATRHAFISLKYTVK